MRVSVAYDSEVRGIIIGKLSDGLQQWYTCMHMHMRIQTVTHVQPLMRGY